MNLTNLIAAMLSTAALVACTETDNDGTDTGLDCEEYMGSCDLTLVGATTPTSSTNPPQPPQPWAPPTLGPWPGTDATIEVDPDGEFSGNLSDLFYERGAAGEPDVMWAVQNGPSRMYKLTQDSAGLWQRQETRSLRFADGTGDVDAEGVTRAELGSTAMYVASERDNLVPLVSRLSILRYDTSSTGTVTATHEWDVTGDHPEIYANAGWEALTWVPDSFLVAQRFIDETTGQPYDPAQYPDHGTGLFFAGLEADGVIYVYALDHTDASYVRVATIESGHESIMGLTFDRDIGYLWAQCDNECENRVNVLAVNPSGKFVPRGTFHRPASLENLNNEGIAFVPEALCRDGRRAFFWTDDGNAHGHALRADSIPCGAFLP